MNLRNFVSPHVHIASLDSASMPEAFVKREQALQTGYLTVTDHGSLAACRKVYEIARKSSLTPILGLEGYFRDDDDPLLKAAGIPKAEDGTYRNYWKYGHLTLHFLDQEAYETGVRLLSRASLRAERHGSELKPLFSWKDLEELGAKNTVFTSSCLIGMVQRHLLDHNDPQMAMRYYQRLKGLVKPGNFLVEVFPHDCSANWDSGVFLTLPDGTEEKLPGWKKLRLSTPGGILEERAKDLALRHFRSWEWDGSEKRQVKLVAVMENRAFKEVEPRVLKKIQLREEFIPNECRPWCPDGDVQAGTNKAMLIMAARFGDPILVSDDSHYAHAEDKVIQDIRLAQSGNWRFFGHYHRQSTEEAYRYFQAKLGISEATMERWVENTHAWAERFKGFTFKDEVSLPTKFYPADSLRHTLELVKKHGRMDWNNKVWVARLQSEIQMLHRNGKIDLLPYFFVIEEVCALYEKHRLLTGPGRGSAAGLLLTYLLGITHVDPLRFGLSQDRFLTLDRIQGGKLPDIDQDLPHRDLLVDPQDPQKGWLKERFGGHVAQISTDTTMKVRSAIKDVHRALHGHVSSEIELLTKRLENAPQGISDHDFVFGYKGSDGWVEGSIKTDPALMEYVAAYPREWELVVKCLGLARQKSRHACAYVVANRPIEEFVPLQLVSDVFVTQYTAAWVEAAGGLKMDFLIVNSLNDIADAIKLIQQRRGGEVQEDQVINGKRVPGHRIVLHPQTGEHLDVWDLPEDQSVFRDFCESKTETVFQFSTPGATQWLGEFNYFKNEVEGRKALDSIEALAAFTALDRPGPLDFYLEGPDGQKHNMMVEFARRSRGEAPSGESLPILNELLPETYGVIVYQEQLTRIFQVLGNTTGQEADAFRVHISKKQASKVIKDKEIFMRGAVERLGEKDATKLWNMMETFASYGFNKSHAVCYVVIAYACAYLKHHYPLEWWTAVLRHASKDEINEKFWPYIGHLIDLPDVSLSGDHFEIQHERIRAPISLLVGVGEKAHQQLLAGRPYRDIDDFCQKIEAFKDATAKMVDQKVRKNGEVVEVRQVRRRGTSALNQGIVNRLIVAGTMDSLFPREISLPDGSGMEPVHVTDQLKLYQAAKARAAKKKRPDPVPELYTRVNALSRYQMKKQILPGYIEDLLPAVETRLKDRLSQVGKRKAVIHDHKDWPFMTGPEARYLDNPEGLWGGPVGAAVACYIVAARKFAYAGGQKNAMEFELDANGVRLKWVKWGERQTGKLKAAYSNPETFLGAVAVVLAYKGKEDRPFSVEEIFVVQPPLEAPEASADTEES